MPAKLLTGNKGEWSEIYVFFYLLGEGKIYAADSKLNRIPDSFLQIVKINREERAGVHCEYIYGDNVRICVNGSEHSSVSASQFTHYASVLLFNLQRPEISGSKGSFPLVPIQAFMEQILVNKIKAPSLVMNESFGGKADITMEVQDPSSGMQLPMGFSIKSDISSKATLVNASEATNFIYEVVGIDDDQMDKFNSINTKFKLVDRAQYLKECQADLIYVRPQRQQAEDNLLVLSETMDAIIAAALKCFYLDDIHPIDKIIERLIEDNPLGLRNPQIIYPTRMKEFLYSCFCGLNLGKPWDGSRNVNGGYIVVKSNGEVLAYHTIIQDAFKQFLVSQCKFDKPSSSRHNYGSIYKENDKYYLKLNLQVRFL